VDREEGTWARRVRERRQALKLSQLELGQLAGLTQQAVSYIERGIGIPRVTTMVRVARSLGTTVEQLVCDAEDDTQSETEVGRRQGPP
jgi:transcriptional regulator with XRE-family HTH domain